MKRIVWPLFAAPLALCACATSKPVYDPVLPFNDAAGVHEFVALADGVPEKAVGLDVPTDYNAINTSAMNAAYANPAISPAAGVAGGLIAGLIIAGIDAAVDAARNAKINDFLSAQGFDAKATFYDTLKTELAADGYTLAVVDTKAGSAAPAAPKLEVKLNHYGFQIAATGWAPTASASVSVTAADGKTVLLRDFVALGTPPLPVATQSAYLNQLGGDALIMPYDPGYTFKDVDAIVKGDPKESVAAATFALRSIAAGVARLMRSGVTSPAPTAQPAQVAALPPAMTTAAEGKAQ